MPRATALFGLSLLPALALGAYAVSGPAAAFISEFGIEGMGVVSTRASEIRASVSPDGQRIVWGSTDRAGGAGGWDLWQATLKDGRWQDARAVADQHQGQRLRSAVQRRRALAVLLLQSPRRGRRRRPLSRAGAAGRRFRQGREPRPRREQPRRRMGADAQPRRRAAAVRQRRFRRRRSARPVRRALGWARLRRSQAAAGGQHRKTTNSTRPGWATARRSCSRGRRTSTTQPVRLFIAQCDGREYAAIAPLALSFNTDDAFTLGPALDWNKPGEMLVTGTAKAPRAGKLDIYRMKAPAASGRNGCI